jgi:acyl-CoA reductase-like NAD-dependent aldehyde dehydrogenase
MTLRGDHFLAGAPELGAGPSFTAIDPHGGAALSPAYREASSAQVDRAASAAGAAAVAFAATPPTVRASRR